MMYLLLLLIIAVFAVIAIVKTMPSLVAQPLQHSADGQWPYYQKKVMTQPELVLYHRLAQALPQHIILCQVQLSRMLGVEKGNNYQSWINRINRQSADFVICGKDGSVVGVIELDDSSHQQARRIEADGKKDRALASAGIRIIRYSVRSMPDIVMIQREFGVSVIPAIAAARPVT